MSIYNANHIANPTPTGNTGVSNSTLPSEYRFSLDWLRYTVSYNVSIATVLPNHPAFALADRPISDLKWYSHHQPLVCGRIDWNPLKPEQKQLVTLTGDDLSRARADGVNEQALVAYALKLADFHATRIDLCIDVTGGPFRDPLDVLEAFQQGRCITKARTANRVDNWRGGERAGITVYIGSRDSLTFVRIYDKRAQMGEGPPWTRIEIEIKGDLADSVCQAVALHGIGVVAKEALRRSVTSGVDWFDRAGWPVSGERLIGPGPHRAGTFERWIFGQCLPALQRALREQIPNVRDTVEEILRQNSP